MRSPLDFYETPSWQTRALLHRVPIVGDVLECCVGDRAISNELLKLNDCRVITNDINPERPADFHLDATLEDSWKQFPRVDWVVTNPPFKSAFKILLNAVKQVRWGVVMLNRISFLEPTEERGKWLADYPPKKQIVLPRWSYKQNGQTDSVTTAWFVWDRIGTAIEIVTPEEKRYWQSMSCEPNELCTS